MTKNRNILRAAAVVAATGLLAAACGSDDKADDGPATQNDLNGATVTVGVENAYLPFNYVPVGGTEGEGWDYDAWR